LFTLDELKIVKINVKGRQLNAETPQGTTLREQSTFARSDGSSGKTFGAVFDTDASDTVFRGERGVAEWQRISGAGNGGGAGKATKGSDGGNEKAGGSAWHYSAGTRIAA
jgi:hypothetical protein